MVGGGLRADIMYIHVLQIQNSVMRWIIFKTMLRVCVMTECVDCDHELEPLNGLCTSVECTCKCFDNEENW